MSVCTYVNICNIIFAAFLAFGCISKHFHCTQNRSHCCRVRFALRWTNSKEPCFRTASEPQRLWNLIPVLGIFPNTV